MHPPLLVPQSNLVCLFGYQLWHQEGIAQSGSVQPPLLQACLDGRLRQGALTLLRSLPTACKVHMFSGGVRNSE